MVNIQRNLIFVFDNYFILFVLFQVNQMGWTGTPETGQTLKESKIETRVREFEI